MVQTVEQFIAHWRGADGGERSQSQSFLNGLCRVLGLPEPKDGDYKFEYSIPGDKGTDFIDLYRRGHFVLEAKQSRAKGQRKAVEGQGDMFTADETVGRGRSSRAWDVLMLNARQQAENYARHLPPSHEWPPFIVVCDVGHCFELYADFTGKGRNYTQFPDRQGFRIFLDDLAKPEIQQRLVKLWTDPHALDPTRRAARATREIAERLAAVSKRLEARKFPAEDVALFLMRCIFTMFAEDAELLPKQSFTDLLRRCTEKPQMFAPELEMLWKAMDAGGYAPAAQERVKQFNGFLFKNATAYALDREEIGELAEAAAKDWREVDPSIFGTLLEQALDPAERSRLGAHYTPRAYVERLVIATVIEPLRDEWCNVLATAERLKSEKHNIEAVAVVQQFHEKLFNTRVLDPACGTGNFLYVTLELMKRLEGEVLEALLNLGGQEALKGFERHEVDPHQFLGLEINARARHIAELVLWLGYLQWHIRTNKGLPSDPVLKDYRNIECRDAVLEHDGVDARGHYINPHRPPWPEADYIVGNPPFIGNKRMRQKLGDAYVDALRAANHEIPGSVDFVMYWWNRAAELVRMGKTRRFGLVTTNSLSQPLNREPVTRFLEAKECGSLLLAIPDHPWTDLETGAAVRVAMTVGCLGSHQGKLITINTGKARRDNSPVIEYSERFGKVNSRLEIGVDYTKVQDLLSNKAVSHQGVILVGEGFRISESLRAEILQNEPQSSTRIVPYMIGNDLTDVSESRLVVDVNDLDEDRLRLQHPRLYQLLRLTVWPERKRNRDKAFREKWWRFGRSRPEIDKLKRGQGRYIATCRSARHRVFVFLDERIVPDAKIIFVGSSDPFVLGVLQSRQHIVWSLRLGAWLGAGNDSNYNHSDIFDPFPFPDADELTRARIADIAERLDRHRKDVQAAHPEITLTQMYNVLEKVRDPSRPDAAHRAPQGEHIKVPHAEVRAERASKHEELTPAERRIFDDALILILKELHDELDAAVAEAYGWPATRSDDEILARLVALNKQRAIEEGKGHVRWLRPDYQIPRFGTPREKQEQLEADLGAGPVVKAKASFPPGPVEQTAAVMAALGASSAPLSALDIAQAFKQGRKVEDKVRATLASLARTGFIAVQDGGRRFALRRVA